MKVEIDRDVVTGDLTAIARISNRELQDLRLDRYDLALLDDCSGPDADAADVLLGLETLFRKARPNNGGNDG